MKTTLATITLIVMVAVQGPVLASDPVIIDSQFFHVGQPSAAVDPGTGNLFVAVGTFSLSDFSWELHMSADGGSTWSEVYSWGSTSVSSLTPQVAIVDDWVYVAYRYTSDSTNSQTVNLRRFHPDTGAMDQLFNGTGILNLTINGGTEGISELVMMPYVLGGAGSWLELAFIRDGYLDSWQIVEGATIETYQIQTGTIVAQGGLDMAVLPGSNYDLFIVFAHSSMVAGDLTMYRREFFVGSEIVDMVPGLFSASGRDLSVSAHGDRVTVAIGSPPDAASTSVVTFESTNGGETFQQDTVTVGVDDVGLHVWNPSVVVGPDQQVMTFLVEDEEDADNENGWSMTQVGQDFWRQLTEFTGYNANFSVPMEVLWIPNGGYAAIYYSNAPVAGRLVFQKLPPVFRNAFEDGSLDGWSTTVQ